MTQNVYKESFFLPGILKATTYNWSPPNAVSDLQSFGVRVPVPPLPENMAAKLASMALLVPELRTHTRGVPAMVAWTALLRYRPPEAWAPRTHPPRLAVNPIGQRWLSRSIETPAAAAGAARVTLPIAEPPAHQKVNPRTVLPIVVRVTTPTAATVVLIPRRHMVSRVLAAVAHHVRRSPGRHYEGPALPAVIMVAPHMDPPYGR